VPNVGLGALDTQLVYGTLLDGTGRQLYCAPADLTADAATRIWLKYVEENPELLVEYAVLSFFSAMSDAFPCDEL